MNANVIFLDLPAGVGFSYATTWEGWRSSDSILAKHSYEFLRKWFVEHPKFLSNPLYITGISYMGILVPPVALEVYKGKHFYNMHFNIIHIAFHINMGHARVEKVQCCCNRTGYQ
ncbi:putative peptidase S10, serine carboxypeptidase, alpha/Beta hydrolase [Helianthus annuus]|nr:putative peptidase S10, serine carboxypeptidase, alpha/Beta hydrolase [Helianthus annuus]